MSIRVGFIVGKDTDLVEDDKYAAIGDSSFLKDLPNMWRVDPESHEFLKNCDPGTKGQAHADVAIAWHIHKHHQDIKVDIIPPEDISMKRLRSNDFNFTMGYNAVNVCVENNERSSKVMRAFKICGNLMPSWEMEDFILYKSKYMKACMNAGVPMAPTIFALKGQRSPADLMKQIKARGWKKFVMKQSESGFSLGFLKLSVEECDADPKILRDYFKDYAHSPEYIVQEAIDGFTRNWETRCFWWNGEFLYAIANMAAVSTEDGAERIVTGDDIPAEFLENAKRIGRQAVAALPQLKAPGGEPVDMILMRTDIGCSDSQIHDCNTHWDPNVKTFFLNEIEPTSTTYFVRHLKFDCIPMFSKLFAESARQIHSRLVAGSAKSGGLEGFRRAMKAMKAPMKAPMKARGPRAFKKVMKAAVKKTKTASAAKRTKTGRQLAVKKTRKFPVAMTMKNVMKAANAMKAMKGVKVMKAMKVKK